MSDRYKFRGKRVDNGEWERGSLCRLAGLYYIACYSVGAGFDKDTDKKTIGGWHQVVKSSIGQYTGYEDKDKTVRWEGDMFMYHDESHVLAWDKDKAGFGLKHMKRGYFVDIVKIYHATFIGTIHDKEQTNGQ
jgi:hypothetical protein